METKIAHGRRAKFLPYPVQRSTVLIITACNIDMYLIVISGADQFSVFISAILMLSLLSEISVSNYYCLNTCWGIGLLTVQVGVVMNCAKSSILYLRGFSHWKSWYTAAEEAGAGELESCFMTKLRYTLSIYFPGISKSISSMKYRCNQKDGGHYPLTINSATVQNQSRSDVSTNLHSYQIG